MTVRLNRMLYKSWGEAINKVWLSVSQLAMVDVIVIEHVDDG